MALEMKSKMSEEIIKKQLEECNHDEKIFMKTLRTKAKACNFGLLFGGSAQGLIAYAKEAYQAHLTEEEANQLYTSFHTLYSAFSEYQKLITQHSRRHGEVETPYSRLTRRFQDSDYWYKGKTRRDPRTIIINHPIQGGAWEILALAQIYLDKNLGSDMYQSHHVHDELVLLVPENKKIEAGRLLLQAFEYGYSTVFPGSDLNGIAEVFSGYTWADISEGKYPLDLKEEEVTL
jgi:DNA polymerase I-like protein with 3'-5' exonuclease and polymerase domains